MYIHGNFINERGHEVIVEILTGGSRTPERVIGVDGIYFADTDAVTTETEINEIFDPVLIQTAKIKLQTRSYIPELFAANCRDVKVNIRWGSQRQLIFAGYVLPMIYSQPYQSVIDDLELSCVDALGALQYRRYGDVGEAGVSWEQRKSDAQVKSLRAIVEGAVSKMAADLVITPRSDETVAVESDGSVKHSQGSTREAIDAAGVSELLFYQDSEEATWTLEDVVGECVRFTNQHIRQEGAKFKIFSWPLAASSGVTEIKATRSQCYGKSTKIELGEIFNKFELTDDLYTVDTVIGNPLEEDATESDYKNSFLYCRALWGESHAKVGATQKDRCSANAMMNAVLHRAPMDWGAATWRDTQWFLRLLKVQGWTFPHYDAEKPQHALPDMAGKSMQAFFCRAQSVTYEYDPDDDSKMTQGSKDTGGYLAVGLPFYRYPYESGEYMTDDMTYPFHNPTLGWPGLEPYYRKPAEVGDAIRLSMFPVDPVSLPDSQKPAAEQPVAKYDGGETVLSPLTNDVTRYLVFSGSMMLNPDIHGPQEVNTRSFYDGVTANSGGIPNKDHPQLVSEYWGQYSQGGLGMCYDSDKWYNYISFYFDDTPGSKVNANPTGTPAPVLGDTAFPIGWAIPMPEETVKPFTVKYDPTKKPQVDQQGFVPLLACRLRVGDKVLVTDTPWTNANPRWVQFKTREECSSLAEYARQCFPLGFNPKKGDELLSTFLEICDTSPRTIEETGFAIPIRQSDRLSGKLTFEILGPYNHVTGDMEATFDDYNDPWWTPHVTDETKYHFSMLNLISGIWIKDFEVKLVSDNGGLETAGDRDIIYTSDTEESYINKKDDLTFRICSALSKERRAELQVNDQLSWSTAIDLTNTSDTSGSAGLQTIYSERQGAAAPAEQLYVDFYYRLMSRPRLLLEQGFKDNYAGWNFYYTHGALQGRKFFPIGISRNLSEGSAMIKAMEL